MLDLYLFTLKGCGPCIRFKPVFKKVLSEYEGRINVIAYEVKSDTGAREREMITLIDRFGVSAYPSFYIDGTNVQKLNTGGLDASELRQVLDFALNMQQELD